MTLNRVSLIGLVGNKPDLYQTDEGTPYARFALATHEHWRDAQDKPKVKTLWHSVLLFPPRLIELARTSLDKGVRILIEGKISYRKIYTDDGREVLRTDVIVPSHGGAMKILDRGKENRTEGSFFLRANDLSPEEIPDEFL